MFILLFRIWKIDEELLKNIQVEIDIWFVDIFKFLVIIVFEIQGINCY